MAAWKNWLDVANNALTKIYDNADNVKVEASLEAVFEKLEELEEVLQNEWVGPNAQEVE